MEGYNGTIFAYGQTGCGKTFTMQVEAPSRYFGLHYTCPARRPATPETPLCPPRLGRARAVSRGARSVRIPPPKRFCLWVRSTSVVSAASLARSQSERRRHLFVVSCCVVSGGDGLCVSRSAGDEAAAAACAGSHRARERETARTAAECGVQDKDRTRVSGV